MGFLVPDNRMKGYKSFLGFVFFFLLHEVKLVFELTKDKWSFLSPITTVKSCYFEILVERKSSTDSCLSCIMIHAECLKSAKEA